MKNKDFKDSRLIDAFSYIDPKYIAEVADSLKLPDGKNAQPSAFKRRGWRHIAVLAACVLLLGAVIPMITYVLRNFGDIASWFTEDTTEESNILTEPETPPEETTQLSPDTTEDETTAEDTTVNETTEPLYDGTTAPPEPEYDGSKGLLYKMREDGKSYYLAGMGTCTETEIVVASNYNGVPVTAIGECALSNNTSLKSIIIPEGVETIMLEAFYHCTSLSEITFPSTLETIGSWAFAECKSLRSINIPDSVKRINDRAFAECVNLTSLNLGAGVEQIMESAFMYCRSLKRITVPGSVKEISNSAFAGCTELDSVTLSKGIEKLGFWIFSDCLKLYEITYTGTKSEWGKIFVPEEAFGNITIKRIRCVDGDIVLVETDPKQGSLGLEYKAFGDYAVLVGIGTCTDKDIVIASEYQGLPVTEIWHEAFVDIKGMRSVKIPEGVTYIESHAFENCPDLRAVYLPASLENITGSLLTHGFYGCLAIETIEIAEGGKKYYSVGNCLIEKQTGTLVFGCGKSSIPADGSVKAIGEYAFNGCRNLVSLALPDGVTDIRTGAFAGCEALRTLTLPKSLKTISQNAFENCTSLASLTLPEGVTEIYNGAFRNCSKLKSVTLPGTLTLIDSEAFLGTAIESIVIPKGVKELGAVFSECEKLVSVTLPSGFEGFVGNTFAGCTLLKSITLPKSLERIGMYTFYGCTALTDLRFEGTIKEWNAISKQERWNESAAFTVVKCSDGDVEAIEYDGSRGLEYKISDDGTYAILVGIGTCTDKDIVIASTYNGLPVTKIDSYALYNCQFIESVVIPEGVTIIHDEAFYLCKNLKKVTLPSTLEWIQYWAFAGCESLERITIPNSVTQISIRAFSDCKNLSSLTLGAGVELIEESAFENCTALDYVRFPKSLRLLANDAFAGCSSLTNIHYAGTTREWEAVDSTGRDYGNNHVWYEGVPAEKITCTNGYIFISPISENEAYEAARVFLGIDKSQIGGKYQFATKAKDPSRLDCYRVALCEYIPDIGYMGEYEVIREVYVNQYTGECTEVVYDYPDIPEVFLDVIFNREKIIYVDQSYSNGEYTYTTKEMYLKHYEDLPTRLFGGESQYYALLDLDGDSFPELIFDGEVKAVRGLILRLYDGKIYGYSWGTYGLMTDGTLAWHEGAGDVQVVDKLLFDGLFLKTRELLRYDCSDPENVKYYVEGKETTKEEYEKFAALYNGEYLDYSALDLYPVYVNPFPGG